MRVVLTIFYLFLMVIGVGFAALNASSVRVNFYFTTFNTSVSVLVILMLGVGMVFGFLVFLGRYWRLKGESRKIRNQLKLTEKEIRNLRAIPLQDQH